MRELEIKPILNGYLVKAGCSTVAFTSIKGLLKGLEAYLKNPERAEKVWLKVALNKQTEGSGQWNLGPSIIVASNAGIEED